jgi:hypothetical protein
MNATTHTERQEIDGQVYVSSNGQLVIDRCCSDTEHLLAYSTRDTQPLHDCRTYLRDLIPKEWIDAGPGTLSISRVSDHRGRVALVQLVFLPLNEPSP